MKVEVIQLKEFRDDRGLLTLGEFGQDVPFTPARFFLISDVPSNQVRGQHAHKTNSQFFVCLSGGMTAKFHDGEKWKRFNISPDSGGLLVPPLHFGKLSDFLSDTKLLVFASEMYDPEEYISEFSDFQKLFLDFI
jgi:dTDP-4-dehydrorhamnose 3,5-epimerase-like enzyme